MRPAKYKYSLSRFGRHISYICLLIHRYGLLFLGSLLVNLQQSFAGLASELRCSVSLMIPTLNPASLVMIFVGSYTMPIILVQSARTRSTLLKIVLSVISSLIVEEVKQYSPTPNSPIPVTT